MNRFTFVQREKFLNIFFLLAVALFSCALTQAQPMGATINNPIVIGTYGAGSYSYNDTKSNSTANGYQNNYGQSSDDIYYKFTIQGSATITISTCGSGFDTYLHLLNSTGGNVLSWDDNGPSCSGLQSSIGIPSFQTSLTSLTAGTYYIVTEGYGSNSGNITLAVNLTVQAPVVYDTRNFIKVWEATTPETNPNTLLTKDVRDVKHTVQYFDGLGRPEQTVVKKGSLSGGVYGDVVSPFVYDEFGREVKKYLTYVSNNANGLYKDNVLTEQNNYYSGTGSSIYNQGETVFNTYTRYEASPLNRVEESFAAGNSWAGTKDNVNASDRRSVKIKYWVNTATDAVRIWKVTDVSNSFGNYATNEIYTSGTLRKSVTEDENGKQVIEFKDKEGNVILKKVQLTAGVEIDGTGSNHAGWLCTYYIYDDLNNLRAVIQPAAVKTMSEYNNWDITNYLNEQCFRYEYDERNRMIMKKVPGAGEVFMVYDARDRVVMSQDANMRTTNKWMVAQYDQLNRPIQTGLLVNSWDGQNKTAAQHRSAAYNSTTYPFAVGIEPSTTYWELLTKTGYDGYTTIPVASGLNNSFDNTWGSSFHSTYNASPYYAQPQIASAATIGMVTWTQTKVLGTASQYLYSVLIYDDNGRVIQAKSKNITGETDIVTTQYSWNGVVLATVQKQAIANPNAQTHTIVTKMDYDELWRVAAVKKKVNTGTEVIVLKNSYDKQGQLKTKEIGQKRNSSDPTQYLSNSSIETLTYDYNIRGWMLGINRSYLAAQGQSGTTKFGFELAYDKQTNTTGQNFGSVANYNGNITGMAWKSDGDDVRRMYSYSYDAANRIMKGDFKQQNPDDNVWNNSKVNFSMQMGNGSDPTLAYDANGNILQMIQYGWKPGGNTNTPIDNLTYSYYFRTNKLRTVIDANNDPLSKLGDFHYATNLDKSVVCYPAFPPDPSYCEHPEDYYYDANGNMVSDRNKSISQITYNYLNLPAIVSVAEKGTIIYTYDASGAKLKKVTEELGNSSNGNITTTTTTLYVGGFVYESKTDNNAQTTDYTNKLQFTGHEEGRIRALYTNSDPNILTGFAFDYMLKDHLGNVRMVLTDELKSNPYPALSFEGNTGSNEVNDQNFFWENRNYSSIDVVNNRTTRPGSFGNSTSNGSYAILLRKSTGSIGATKLLKVMSGDRINARVDYYYTTTGANNTTANGLNSMISSLLNALSGSSATAALIKDAPGTITGGLNANGTVNSFFSPQNASSGTGERPKAYLHVLLFDEMFNFDADNSYVKQVGDGYTPGTLGQIDKFFGNAVEVKKNGYAFVYISNESDDFVYFDNLLLTHDRGPILEETHYYPFGLTMAGISSKAAGGLENRFKYNEGTELTSDLDLNLYETPFRGYDPQLGRFHQIDQMADSYEDWSPYSFALNNPISLNDPTGLEPKKEEERKETSSQENPTQLSEVVVTASRKNKWNYKDWMAFADKFKDLNWSELNAYLKRDGVGDRGLNMFAKAYDGIRYRQIKREIDDEWAEMQEAFVFEAAQWVVGGVVTKGVVKVASWGYKSYKVYKRYRAIKAIRAAKTAAQAENKVFLVTSEGVVLPKGAKIPSELIQNANRSSSYGVMENGKFVEKLRIDPARFAEPSHFHVNGSGRKLTNWRWF